MQKIEFLIQIYHINVYRYVLSNVKLSIFKYLSTPRTNLDNIKKC